MKESSVLEQNEDELSTIKDESYWKFDLSLKNIQVKLANSEKEFYSRRSEADNSDQHILTPLDIILNLEKCAYSDDINLPALRVVGELPLINLALTDMKLVNALKILSNLEGKATSESDDHHFYIEDLSPSSSLNSLSSTDNEAELAEFSKNINTIVPTQTSENESLKSNDEVPLQNISIELKFEIKDIFLTISEENKEKLYFNKILFRLSSIGALVQVKSYDIVGNIYLSYIALEYDLIDSTAKKLYLISSLPMSDDEVQNIEENIKNEKNRLIDIQFIKTDETSPTLSTLHQNVLCGISIEFRSLDFLIDECAISNVLRFLNGLNKTLNSQVKSVLSSTVEVNKATKLIESSTAQQVTGFGKLDESQINSLLYNQRQQSLNRDSLLGNQKIDFKVTAKINSIKMKLSNLTKQYFQVLIQNFEMNLKKTKVLTELDMILTRISLQDIRENSVYKEIVKLKDDGKNLIEFNLKFFEKHYLNKKIYLKSYLNENDFDLIINGKLSKLQCVFLYQHLSIIFVSRFFLNFFFFFLTSSYF